MAEIIARTLTATPPRYSTIKELDRKIREISFPPEVLDAIRGGPGVDPLSVPLPASMEAFTLSTLPDASKSSSLPDTTILRAKRKPLSLPVSPSQLLCPGSRRKPRRPNKEPICTVIFGDCPSVQKHFTTG